MFNPKSPNEYQQRLINTLREKMTVRTIPKPKIIPPKSSVDNISLAGRGTLDDHMRMMKKYICACGRQIGDIDHNTVADSQTAIDTYSMNCSNCGDEKEISFMSLRRALETANGGNSNNNEYQKSKTNKDKSEYSCI